jgi:putative membrane protein
MLAEREALRFVFGVAIVSRRGLSMRMLIAAAAFLAVAGTAALAQQKTPGESVAFAQKVAAANTFEIQSSELAQDRAQSNEVKSFAKWMVADHTKLGQEFKSAVQAANISPSPREQPNAKQKATLSKLRSAHGPAFDRAYLAAQLSGHKEAVSLLRKYAKNGRTPQLKEFAQNALPVVEQHLSKVTELSSQAVAARQNRTGVGSRAIGPPAGREKNR